MHVGHLGRADRIEGLTPRGSQGWGGIWAAAPRAAQLHLEVEEGAGQAEGRRDQAL